MSDNEILDRISYFLKFKHWSLYKLAKESGLSYSSINNIFNRQTYPTIPTLEKICFGLNISLAEFFDYKKNPLRNDLISEDEQDILNLYRTLSNTDKELLAAYLSGLCKK